VKLLGTWKPLFPASPARLGLVLAAALIGFLVPDGAAGQDPKGGPPTVDSWDKERGLTTGTGPRYVAYNFARFLAADRDGRVHVVWYEARNGKDHAFYRRFATRVSCLNGESDAP
jgi:hypothetical protein